MKVVEHNSNPIDLYFGFGEHYQDRELFCHICEEIPLQLDAQDQSKHPSNIHTLEHGHFPSFLVY